MANVFFSFAMLVTSFAFESSGLLPVPREYQSDAPGRAPFGYAGPPVSPRGVTSRQCSIIRRTSMYERAPVPFICHAQSGKTLPLPQEVDDNTAAILKGMYSQGWKLCQQPMTVPIYRYQRIPTCCPGTIPAPNGGCFVSSYRPSFANQSPCANGGLLMVRAGHHACECRPGYYGLRCLNMDSRGDIVPSPGQLLMATKQGIVQPIRQVYPQSQILLPASPPVVFRTPSSFRRFKPYLSSQGRQPGDMGADRFPNSRGIVLPGPVFENQFPQRQFASQQYPSPLYPYPQYPSRQYPPRQYPPQQYPPRQYPPQQYPPRQYPPQQYPPRQYPPQQYPPRQYPSPQYSTQQYPSPQNPYSVLSWPSSPRNPYVGNMAKSGTQSASPVSTRLPGQSSGQDEMARYLAAMMMYQMISERQRQQWERQTQIKQRMELFIQQQLREKLHRQQPTDVPESPNTDPSPIPPPPLRGLHTTPVPEQDSAGDEISTESNLHPGAILEQLDSQPKEPPFQQPVFGEGPVLAQQETSSDQMMIECRKKADDVVNNCLNQSGITVSLHDIVETNNRLLFQQVCRNNQSVGPCIIKHAAEVCGDGQAGQVGKQILQSTLFFLGRSCMGLQMEDEPLVSSEKSNDITSTAIFPNPAPSMTSKAITESVPDQSNGKSPALSEDDVLSSKLEHKHLESRPQAKGPEAKEPQPHVFEEEMKIASASFPMWMILAVAGGCAVLLLLTCIIIVCCCVRLRRKKKSVKLQRQPEKLPIPPVENNLYAVSPFVPPPLYATTPVKQTLGEETEKEQTSRANEADDTSFKVPADETEK